MLNNVPSLSHQDSLTVNPGNGKRNPSWLVVFRPKDLWPQLHVATPRCSWWDVINSIKDCENPLNTLSPLLFCRLTVRKSNEFPAIVGSSLWEAVRRFHCLSLSLKLLGRFSHTCPQMCTRTHTHTPQHGASLFVVHTRRGINHSAVRHLAFCPVDGFYSTRENTCPQDGRELCLMMFSSVWTFEPNSFFAFLLSGSGTGPSQLPNK